MAETDEQQRWYEGITRYQWLVLFIASLGWIFDVFEGQIFVASMNEAMPSLVPPGTSAGRIAWYNNVAFAAFLLGGSLGGILFGAVSDRIGRKRALSWTILVYSLFTCLSAFSGEWWHLAWYRFLVAIGVGGEWAVASAMIAEVFPRRARAHVGSIFHASSVLGVYLAIATATMFIANPAVHAWAQSPGSQWISRFFDPASLPWRMGFALGAVPALLIIWIRLSLHEPESWQTARAKSSSRAGEQLGAISDLFRVDLLRRTMVALTLAAVGQATFWGVHIYGKDMLRTAAEQRYIERSAAAGSTLGDEPRSAILTQHATSLKRWEMLGMFLVTTGGGIGLLAFGPISERLGRRGAFLFFQLGGLAGALVVFQVLSGVTALLVALPIFGFLTLGMHAGFAVYFPELYPTRLRGAGAGLCFNGGRLLAAPVLIAVGWLRDGWDFTLPDATSVLSLLFVPGIIVLALAPETRGRDLPE